MRFGDPRKFDNTHDIVDWIEKIPYSETRNYVQRVIENMQIYHSIINRNKDFEVRISKDLRE
jgi:soluble lytic murein transglycosylase